MAKLPKVHKLKPGTVWDEKRGKFVRKRSFPQQLGAALIGEKLYDLKHHLSAAQEILAGLIGEHNLQANRKMKR